MARRKTDQDALTRSLVLFGVELKFHRERQGLSQQDLATKVHCARSLIGMIETGQRAPADDEFPRRCDEVLNTGGSLGRMWTSILDEEAKAAKTLDTYTEIEQAATAIRHFQLQWLPGLLQTEEYARTLFELDIPGQPDAIEDRLSVRMSRQNRLSGEDSLMYTALIDESALRRTIGSPALMRRQLEHLLTAGERPNVVIQALPFSAAGAYPFDASVIFFDLPEEPLIAYIEALNYGQVVSVARDVAVRARRFEMLRSHALSVRETRALIRSIIEEEAEK
ncbi:helix-turn-helix domain-containing protein [Kitasatospora sp. NBC_01287]|uniref:helix-turn-helix domain-containing protein n=1 Tax=Kitasatospora sp. NBC_01287 TaxID=2903573 RepID=UPI00225369A8|nr:helix-turn-helix transcriptional regulator [Kitasatospora sp. NBC_01287]MCX4747831.1 helix-turn-helix domain-containing protein [Kitasatospora sp. NBC_01287]